MATNIICSCGGFVRLSWDESECQHCGREFSIRPTTKTGRLKSLTELFDERMATGNPIY